ncbi:MULTISPECIES: EAL domain-containing protein [Pseudoalteromonas]|uniref:EAL domain-containing protein n=1 Tax=Pseudoalteromonas obscura TaxID=3048491 RepID=A0ABT7EHH6_9GAMM|nr:EAL domain-containing protein [Pseudoalteromonas sp. P94(2023)]MBQ4836161.1 EAL domain-containing protein [Pseudoalteromonas luteoviolacea]MDK2594510.1 EAL domain-containing protein [Pseudoalteromonas sp. P94(2023)]
MGNRRPPSRFGANSLSVKLSILISAVCVIAGVFAAALMLKSEEKHLVEAEFVQLHGLSEQVLQQFSHYLELKKSLAQQTNAVVSKKLLSATEIPLNTELPLTTSNGRMHSVAANGMSAAYILKETLSESDQALFQKSENLWNILSPILLQDFFNFYIYTTENFVRIAPPNSVLLDSAQNRQANIHAQPLLREELNPTREAVWSDVHHDPIWSKWVVSILVPLYEGDVYRGFTGSDLELETLLSRLPKPTAEQSYIIFDKQGRIISAPNLLKDTERSELLTKDVLPSPIQRVIDTALKVNLPSYQDEFVHDKAGHIANVMHLGELDWYVGMYKRRDTALHALEELKVKFFGLFVLYAGFVAMLLHQVIYHLILKRINQLVKVLISFGRGQWDHPKLADSDDEIGLLNASFNDMSDDIKKLVNGLNQRINEKEIAEKAANRLSKAVAFSGTGVVITNERFKIEYVNPKMVEMTGFSESHFLDAPLLDIISSEMAILIDDIDFDLKSRNYWRGDTLLQSSNNDQIWVSLSISPIRENGGRISSYVASAQDISFVKESQRKMEELAYFDTLTGLANRTFFRMQLRKSMALASRGHYAFALFYFDLDEFKRINDTLGHDAGDRLLVEVADRLKQRLRAEDTIARLGGDEFAVLLSGISTRDNAMDVAHTIQKTLSQPISLGNNEVIVSASIGITLAPFDSQEEEQLLKHADLAMYEAKAKGRNTFHFYSQELNAAANERLHIENELRQAIKSQQFSLQYQPQIDSRSGKIVGYEALIRWNHPTEGGIPPTKFIPIAEATGLIVEIGTWVLKEACRFSSVLKSKGYTADISINLSARQFKDANLIETISHTLDEVGLPPSMLHLELTESMLMGDVEAAIEQLKEMKKLGVSLSIDDFGTGYSSLSYLKRFPVDVLKVDRSFVKDIPEDSNDMEITAAIIAMAQKLSMKVVAEGVETAEQVAFLQRNNCHIVQGYYYSAPLTEQQVFAQEPSIMRVAGN